MKNLLFVLCLVAPMTFAGSEKDVSVKVDGRSVNCRPHIWGVHTSSSGRCLYNDEVMVGIKSVNPVQILCARLDIQCTSIDSESDSNQD